MNYPQIKPTLNLDFSNTKTLDPRINFRRGTPGAYYDGKTYTKAEENLLSYSEDFSEWHSVFSTNETSQNDPSGGTGATLLKEDDSAEESHGLRFDGLGSFASFTTFTFSVYLKKKERDYVDVSIHGAANQYASVRFNLSGGVVDQSTSAGQFTILEKNIESVTGDWYRAIITAETGGSNSDAKIYIGMSNDSDVVGDRGIISYTGDGSSGFYIWGAQLEQRDSLTAYTPTNGDPITKYQPQLMFASPDQPRFDHDPITGESKGLLIEESRTNLVWYSENFAVKGISNPESAWLYTRCSLDTNGPISPDGTTLSVIMKHDTTVTNGGGLYMSGDSDLDDKYIPAGTNTYSWYAKNAGVNFFVINTGGNKVFFDLTNGTAKSFATLIDSYGIEHVGNGWYRCHVVTSQATNLYFYQSDQDDDASQTVSGAGGVAVWGPQFEQGSFPTSYIKTTSDASVTRSADNASITGENFSSWYRQDEGSVYCEALKNGLSTNVVLSINDATDDNRMFINLRDNEQFEVTKNSANQAQIGKAGIDYNNFNKICATYKKDASSVCVDGSTVSSDTTCEIPYVDRLLIGQNYSSNVLYNYNCYIKKISYYPQRLTNEQLQQLTK